MKLAQFRLCVFLLPALAASVGCASLSGATLDAKWVVLSHQAVALIRGSGAKLIDTRSHDERSGRVIWDSVPVQYGPDHWSSAVSVYEGSQFLIAISTAGMSKDDLIITICNAGFRARAAAAFLRDQGFANVYSVSGGYLGNDRDAGWQFAH